MTVPRVMAMSLDCSHAGPDTGQARFPPVLAMAPSKLVTDSLCCTSKTAIIRES
jgi:hypothetical protein